jgi:hypothetical protein
MKNRFLLASVLVLALLPSPVLAYTQIKVFKDLASGKIFPFKKWNTRIMCEGYIKVFNSGRIGVDIPGSLLAMGRSVEVLNRVRRTRLTFTYIKDGDKFYDRNPNCLDDGNKQYYGNTFMTSDDTVNGTRLLAGTGFICSKRGSYDQCPSQTTIIFDYNQEWYTAKGRPSSDQYDFVSLAVHELLHATGQNHVPERFCRRNITSPTMCPTIDSGEVWMRSLEPSDIQGMQEMYP